MVNIRDLYLEEIENDLLEMGEKKYRAKQIFAWLFRGVESFEEMTDLSKGLIEKLKQKYELKCTNIINHQHLYDVSN